MPLDSAALIDLIEKSRLVKPDEMEEVRQLGEELPESQAFLKTLVKRNILTRWQAGQIFLGNTSFYLGKYKLVELLGAGGMGRVFRAEHTTMNRRVALKIIGRDLMQDDAAKARFLNEARAIAALNHPNIVHAYSIDKEGDRYYIVMEFVDGQDLEKIVNHEGMLDEERATHYVLQVAGALAHAHEHGMIHCDIKPSNLILNDQGQIKVLDMGLVRLYNTDTNTTDSGISDPHKDEPIGSVDYMAPEMAEDSDSISPAVDIYSLGCVYYFLLTGCIPFPGGSLPERILKHQTEDPTDPQILNPRVSRRIADICLKMMARKVQDRYESAQEVAEILMQWCTDQADLREMESEDPFDFSAGGAGAAAPVDSGSKSGVHAEMDFLAGVEGSSAPKPKVRLSGIPGFEEKSRFSPVDTSRERTPVRRASRSSDKGSSDKGSSSTQSFAKSQGATTQSFDGVRGGDFSERETLPDIEADVLGGGSGLSKKKAASVSDTESIDLFGDSSATASAGGILKRGPVGGSAGAHKKGAKDGAIAPAEKKRGMEPWMLVAIVGGLIAVLVVGLLLSRGGGGTPNRTSKRNTENIEEVGVLPEDETLGEHETLPETATKPLEQGEKSDDKSFDTTAISEEDGPGLAADPKVPEGSEAPVLTEGTPNEGDATEQEVSEKWEEKSLVSEEERKRVEAEELEARKGEEEKIAKEEELRIQQEEAGKNVGNPFEGDKAPRSVALPRPANIQEVELAKIESAALPWTLTLLGGEYALPSKGKKAPAKKEPKKTEKKGDKEDEAQTAAPEPEQAAVPSADGFTLREGENTEAATMTWNIFLNERGQEKPAAELRRDENTLKFKWTGKGKQMAALGNCMLKWECNGHTHKVLLREPVELSMPVLDFGSGRYSQKDRKGAVLAPFPSADVVFVEIRRFGELKNGTDGIQMTQSTPLSEISKEKPLKVEYPYSGRAGTLPEANRICFLFKLLQDTGKLSLENMALLRSIKDRKKQVSKMEATKRTWENAIVECDKAGTGATQDQIRAANSADVQQWFQGVAEGLEDRMEVEYRIYMKLDGQDVDLVTTVSASSDEKEKPKRSSRARGKKKSDEDE